MSFIIYDDIAYYHIMTDLFHAFSRHPLLLCFIGKDGKITRTSAFSLASMNLDAKDIDGVELRHFIATQDQSRLEAALSGLSEHSLDYVSFAATLVSGAQEEIPCEWKIIPLPDNLNYLVLGSDARPSLKIQTQLWELEETKEIAKIGSWSYSLIDDFVTLSDNAFELIQVTKTSNGQIPSSSFFSTFRSSNPEDNLKNLLLKSTKLSSQFSGEYLIISRTSKQGWVQINATPVFNKQRKLLSFRGIICDITEKRKAALEIESLKNIAENSARLAAIGEMASAIAHEINNPLSVICARTALLLDDPDQFDYSRENVINFTKKIDQTADRINRIVKSMRYVSRDASNDLYENAQVSELITQTVELCSNRFSTTKVELRAPTQVSSTLQIQCRPSQIAQVLSNLLSNARDAVENLSQRWVEIQVKDIGDAVELRILDSGKGIPPEFLEKIFDPYFTTKGIGKGTGLGLSISSRIVKEHGGTIYVDKSAQHTCFVLKLFKNFPRVQDPKRVDTSLNRS